MEGKRPLYIREYEGETIFDFDQKVFACQRLTSIAEIPKWLKTSLKIGTILELREGPYIVKFMNNKKVLVKEK